MWLVRTDPNPDRALDPKRYPGPIPHTTIRRAPLPRRG
jgi:hypothetical protein